MGVWQTPEERRTRGGAEKPPLTDVLKQDEVSKPCVGDGRARQGRARWGASIPDPLIYIHSTILCGWGVGASILRKWDRGQRRGHSTLKRILGDVIWRDDETGR